jgi:hypothetical protein
MIEGNINEKLKGKRETNLDSVPFVVKQGDMDADWNGLRPIVGVSSMCRKGI